MRILVYGDSNSWGYPPDGSGIRYDEATRWPRVMATLLGADMVEDCLPGRTTRHADPEMMGEAMSGLRHLQVSVRAHAPLDLVLIMLGTNDLKARFGQTAERIANSAAELVALARNTPSGRTHWEDETPPNVGVIVPPPPPAGSTDPTWERCAEWTGALEVSRGLASAFGRAGERHGFPVFDAAQAIETSPRDNVHFEADAHRALGRAVADWLRELTLRTG